MTSTLRWLPPLEPVAHALLTARPFKGRNQLAFFLLRFLSQARTAYGPRMRPRVWDWTSRAAFAGFYGTELADLIAATPEDGTFLDIGANAGLFSLLASRRLARGRVVSVEPNPVVYRDLLANIEMNGARNVVPLNLALGRVTGLASFAFDRGHTGGGHLDADAAGDARKVLVQHPGDLLPVLGLSRDRFCLCKIDTEGAELQVLEALAEAEALPLIDLLFVEIDDANLRAQGASAEAVYRLLDGQGFAAEKGPTGGAHYDEVFRRKAGPR